MLINVFARLLGFFVLSPLFAQKGIPTYIRFGSALVSSLLIAPPLSIYMDSAFLSSPMWILQAFQELILGYLIGLLFSLLIEAGAFAGQLVGTLIGFSFAEVLDPLTQSRHPLLAKSFTLILMALFFALDLHHLLLRLLYGSFSLIPLQQMPSFVMDAGMHFFEFALSYALLPLMMLLTLLFVFALISRFLPHLQIFFTGVPLQLLCGLLILIVTVGYFEKILVYGFSELLSSVKKIFSLSQ